jgi:hypothetical protein
MLMGVSQNNFITVAIVVGTIWTGLIALACVLTVRYAPAGDSAAARGRAGTALAMVLVPVALWTSVGTPQEMWP